LGDPDEDAGLVIDEDADGELLFHEGQESEFRSQNSGA
jgi:hypothetical protein